MVFIKKYCKFFNVFQNSNYLCVYRIDKMLNEVSQQLERLPRESMACVILLSSPAVEHTV
jgi:hypothetical protein